MRTGLQFIVLAAGIIFGLQSQAPSGDTIFPKGELSTVKNHTGNIWLKELNIGDSTFDSSIAVATYDAGAKLDWHIHPGGQVLLITEGTGYYQERGKPIQVVRKGDADDVASPSACILDADNDVGFRAAPRIGEAEDVLEQFALLVVRRLDEGILVPLEVESGAFLFV